MSWLQGGAVLLLLFLLWLGSEVYARRQTDPRWMGDDHDERLGDDAEDWRHR